MTHGINTESIRYHAVAEGGGNGVPGRRTVGPSEDGTVSANRSGRLPQHDRGPAASAPGHGDGGCR